MSKHRFIQDDNEKYYYIEDDGEIYWTKFERSCITKNRLKIGNVFKTEEEAEKAVEKLRALRRLREKGLKFKSWEASGIHITIHASIPDISYSGQDGSDLILLFKEEDD